MKPWRILTVFLVAGLFLGVFLSLVTADSLAAEPGGTVLPLGLAQTNPRVAYRDALSHIYGGGRAHWVAAPLSPTVQQGDLFIPSGLSTSATSFIITETLPLSRAYALQPGSVAILRSTVVVTTGQNQWVAMWELAEVRQLFDGYLMGAVPYVVLDEAAVAAGGLQNVDFLIIPAIRADAVLTVTQALSETGVLAALYDFVAAGGTLYAQSNGAYIAEAAELLSPGTVDLQVVVEPTGADPNAGVLQVHLPDSPLAWSWLTDTLYILTDPLLHPTPEMEVVAMLANAGDAPAVVRAPVGQGQVILVVGHPTAEARRLQVPLFMNALFLGLSSRVELTGDAIQTLNPAYDPHEFPAYEATPVSATLIVRNLWDAPMLNATLTETVSAGYTVLTPTGSIAPTTIYTVTEPTTATVLVWELGALAPGTEITLGYWAESDPQALAAGRGLFSQGVLRYEDPDLGRIEVAHRPFVLTAQMAARLFGARELEADRHFRIPAGGLYLKLALALENKEWTLANPVSVTEWIYLISPIVDIENNHVILSTNDGETIWMLNEPFLWENGPYPLPVGETVPTRTYTLEDWTGDWCVFTSTEGIYIDPPPGNGLLTEDWGSFITIPPTYTDYITVTVDQQLLLPCLPLHFDLGPWPGYWYEELALSYGVHSRELFSRTVVFHGTPREGTVVMPFDAGTVYVAAGTNPVPYRGYLTAEEPYAPAAPALPGVTYQDIWSRTHFMPFHAVGYDVWDWDSCATCDRWAERHAAMNITFGFLADLDRDGVPETAVREIPTGLPETWVTYMGKSYNLAEWTIPADMNLVDFAPFHGLGIMQLPRYDSWWDSYRSPSGRTVLITVTPTAAYDHLLFQQAVPPGEAEVFYVDARLLTYADNHEGMFKLHDGARFVYRQMFAGPNRYEIYDSHVHSALGISSDARLTGWAGPTAISVYGDSLYYQLAVDDRYDPRGFNADPYMNSWGYGDFVATSYVGGREEKLLFRSLVTAHDRTMARLSYDNNIGVMLEDFTVDIETPDWITLTQRYTDSATAPEPIWPELAYLNLTDIPDAWRGVYYYDVEIGAIPEEWLGQVITLPVHIGAVGLPIDYEAPPLVLGLRGVAQPEIVFGPAHDLVVTMTVPVNVSVNAVALVDAVQSQALIAATDFDALHPLSDTAATLFETFALTLPFAVDAEGVLTVTLPQPWRTLPATDTLRLAVSATITRAHHGPNQVSDGGAICYTDSFGMRWCDSGIPLTVEAAGAAVWVDYHCEGGSAEVIADGAGHCTIPPYGTSTLNLRVTAFNEGDALARGVTATVALPLGVSHVETPLTFGDLAPGGWRGMRITLEVTPGEEHIQATPYGWQLQIVNHTWGQFFDTASQRLIAGQFGDDYAVSVLWRPRAVYLPLALRGYDMRPDLTITALEVDAENPDRVFITVVNIGGSTARDFWVDLYFDPTSPPEVNQAWPQLSLYGAAWYVSELPSGESLLLTIGDAYYQADYSRWFASYPDGEHVVWAYVDSWGSPNPWAGVREQREDNNRYGPLSFLVSGTAAQFTESAPLPERPRYPGGEQ